MQVCITPSPASKLTTSSTKGLLQFFCYALLLDVPDRSRHFHKAIRRLQMLKKIIFVTLFSSLPYVSFAQASALETPEVKYCRQTSDMHDRIWEGCLYSMGELVAKQVKDAVGAEDFSKHAASVSSKCRTLRRKLESEAGGSFPAQVPQILSCNVENWAAIRNKAFKEAYPS